MNNQFVEIMRCRVGEQEFGILRAKMQSVQHGNRVRIVQDTDDEFEAFLPTTEGDLIVLRLADFVSMQSSVPISDQRLLILRSRWGLWCLLVDEVSQAQFVNAETIQQLPPVARVPLADSVYTEGDTVLLMVEPDNIHPNAQTSAETTPPDHTELDLETVQPASQGHLVLFKMPGTTSDNEQYAVGLTPKQIDQVLRNPVIKSVPTAPSYLKGVVSWRGRLVPVLDLGQRFGLRESAETEFTKQDRVVIMHGLDADKMVGFYADPAVDIVTLPAPHSSLSDVNVSKTLIYGAARYSGQRVLIPHVENLALTA